MQIEGDADHVPGIHDPLVTGHVCVDGVPLMNQVRRRLSYTWLASSVSEERVGGPRIAVTRLNRGSTREVWTKISNELYSCMAYSRPRFVAVLPEPRNSEPKS